MKLRKSYTYPLICLLILASHNLSGADLPGALESDEKEQTPIQSHQVKKSFEQEEIERIYTRYKADTTLDALKEMWCMFFTLITKEKNYIPDITAIEKIIKNWPYKLNKAKNIEGNTITFQQLLEYWHKHIKNEQQICHSIYPI